MRSSFQISPAEIWIWCKSTEEYRDTLTWICKAWLQKDKKLTSKIIFSNCMLINSHYSYMKYSNFKISNFSTQDNNYLPRSSREFYKNNKRYSKTVIHGTWPNNRSISWLSNRWRKIHEILHFKNLIEIHHLLTHIEINIRWDIKIKIFSPKRWCKIMLITWIRKVNCIISLRLVQLSNRQQLFKL